MTHDAYLDHVQYTAYIAYSECISQGGDLVDLDDFLIDVVSWRYDVHPLAQGLDDLDLCDPALQVALDAATLAYLADARKALADVVALAD